jgi:hypothetical protein
MHLPSPVFNRHAPLLSLQHEYFDDIPHLLASMPKSIS